MDFSVTPKIQKEIDRLPQGFDHVSDEMRFVVAALQAADCYVHRADDAKEYIDPENDDMYYHSMQPSIMLSSKTADHLIRKQQELISTMAQNHEEFLTITNEIMRANIQQYRRLFALLKVFYAARTPKYHAQLIIESSDIQGIFLKPLGSNIRALEDRQTQHQWAIDMQHEMVDFGLFVMRQLESHADQS